MLVKKLEEQLNSLRNSAELYDKGRTEAALDIAIRLRVLFYKNDSLLGQLGQKKTLNLLSTMEDHSKNPMLKNITIQSSIPFLTSNGQRAFLNDTSRSEFIPAMEWLTETITTLENKHYSRIDIIKITAHKDGAAHIEIDDKTLKPFITPRGKITIKENNKPVTKVISNHHYILLRQFAYEVLHSEELFTINNLEYKPMEEIKSYNEYLIEADKFYEKNNYFKAIKLYEKAIDVNPKNAVNAYNNMGICLCQMGEKEDGIKSYKKAIELDNKYIDPLWNLAILYQKEKKYDFALRFYEKVLNINKEYNKAKHNYTVILNILTDIKDEVIEQYKSYQSNKPKNITYIDCLALSLIKFNYITEAEDFYKYSLTITPKNVNHLNNLAYTLYKQEKYFETNKIFNNIIDLGTSRIDIIINILEFKLIKDFDNYSLVLQFLKNKNNLYYQIFDLLFKLKSNEKIDEKVIELTQKETKNQIKYDYSEIEAWIIYNNLNLKIVTILKKYFTKK